MFYLELQEALSYDELVSMLLLVVVILFLYVITNGLVWILKTIHCHRIMKKGELHRCHYWTCVYFSVCPYNSLDYKKPRKFSKFLNKDCASEGE